jgi:hypothetical protein
MPVPSDDPLAKVRELTPVRDLPRAERQRLGVPREGRSRPRTIAPAPPPRDNYLEQLAHLRAEAAAADPIVDATTDPERSAEVLDQTLLALAVEAAAIGFERVRAEREGRDVGQLCSRRVDGLSRLASLVVERARWEPDTLDLRSPKMQKAVDYFNAMLAETAEETLGPDAQRLLAGYQARLVGWQDKIDPPPRGRSG